MVSSKNKNKLKSLSRGRPPVIRPSRSISSKATRTLIRSYHTLEKERAKALAAGDAAKATSLSEQIESQGGIESYQKASLVGQGNDRGGDSSKVLMKWLEPIIPTLAKEVKDGQPIRLLEIGALSTTNACSRSRLFDIERIDLNSQAAGIKKQDFMDRPLPGDWKDQFDIISLSLVLNYVPDAIKRGEMLLRTLKFLKVRQRLERQEAFFSSLFLVLPAPCVTNSRYMDEAKLEAIMESLGYVQTEKKLSNKLVYYLWRLETPIEDKPESFPKKELRSGKTRNNFAIILK